MLLISSKKNSMPILTTDVRKSVYTISTSILHWWSLFKLCSSNSSKNLKTIKIGNSSLYFWIAVHVWYHDIWSNKFLYKRNTNQDQPIHNILLILRIIVLSREIQRFSFSSADKYWKSQITLWTKKFLLILLF